MILRRKTKRQGFQEAIELAVAKLPLNNNVFPFLVAKPAHSLTERLNAGRVSGKRTPPLNIHLGNFRCLLRLGERANFEKEKRG